MPAISRLSASTEFCRLFDYRITWFYTTNILYWLEILLIRIPHGSQWTFSPPYRSAATELNVRFDQGDSGCQNLTHLRCDRLTAAFCYLRGRMAKSKLSWFSCKHEIAVISGKQQFLSSRTGTFFFVKMTLAKKCKSDIFSDTSFHFLQFAWAI